jgi:hypothetical protein
LKRLIVLALVVVLVTVMSAPAALFAMGGNNNGGNNDCKKKHSSKCEYPKVKICHKPDTPAAKILRVPQSAVSGHLGHGDFVIDNTPGHSAKDCKKKNNCNNNGDNNGNNNGNNNGGNGKR